MNSLDRELLRRVARQAMVDYGLAPDFPPGAEAQAQALPELPVGEGDVVADLRHLPWTSIDNRESRDLDQIEAIEEDGDGTRLYVGIADVAGAVPRHSSIDAYAAGNTTSVYTGVQVFTMLPLRLSYELTSLLPGQERRVRVIDMRIAPSGRLEAASVYPALAVNQAKLNYPAISHWLDGGATPPELAHDRGLQAQVRSQDVLAQQLRKARMEAGALDLETAEPRPVLGAEGELVGLEPRLQDRAGSIIEELMIVANRAVVRRLDEMGSPCVLRVVRRPEHWDLIVEYAASRGVRLPDEPDSLALARFLEQMRARRAREFHEISLSIVKLIGRGEYVAHRPGEAPIGHFGLAAPAYGHATAPNRRYPDLIMQRLLGGEKATADVDDLEASAQHCTAMEAQAEKVERRVRKSIAAALVAERVGEVFDGIVTKAQPESTFVRVLHPALEGMIVTGRDHVRVGDKVRVRLASVDIERSLIDFELA